MMNVKINRLDYICEEEEQIREKEKIDKNQLNVDFKQNIIKLKNEKNEEYLDVEIPSRVTKIGNSERFYIFEYVNDEFISIEKIDYSILKEDRIFLIVDVVKKNFSTMIEKTYFIASGTKTDQEKVSIMYQIAKKFIEFDIEKKHIIPQLIFVNAKCLTDRFCDILQAPKLKAEKFEWVNKAKEQLMQTDQILRKMIFTKKLKDTQKNFQKIKNDGSSLLKRIIKKFPSTEDIGSKKVFYSVEISRKQLPQDKDESKKNNKVVKYNESIYNSNIIEDPLCIQLASSDKIDKDESKKIDENYSNVINMKPQKKNEIINSNINEQINEQIMETKNVTKKESKKEIINKVGNEVKNESMKENKIDSINESKNDNINQIKKDINNEEIDEDACEETSESTIDYIKKMRKNNKIEKKNEKNETKNGIKNILKNEITIKDTINFTITTGNVSMYEIKNNVNIDIKENVNIGANSEVTVEPKTEVIKGTLKKNKKEITISSKTETINQNQEEVNNDVEIQPKTEVIKGTLKKGKNEIKIRPKTEAINQNQEEVNNEAEIQSKNKAILQVKTGNREPIEKVKSKGWFRRWFDSFFNRNNKDKDKLKSNTTTVLENKKKRFSNLKNIANIKKLNKSVDKTDDKNIQIPEDIVAQKGHTVRGIKVAKDAKFFLNPEYSKNGIREEQKDACTNEGQDDVKIIKEKLESKGTNNPSSDKKFIGGKHEKPLKKPITIENLTETPKKSLKNSQYSQEVIRKQQNFKKLRVEFNVKPSRQKVNDSYNDKKAGNAQIINAINIEHQETGVGSKQTKLATFNTEQNVATPKNKVENISNANPENDFIGIGGIKGRVKIYVAKSNL